MTNGLNGRRGDALWLIAVAGLILGTIVTLAGIVMLEDGPAPLIVGLVFLAFGGGSLFTYLSRE